MSGNNERFCGTFGCFEFFLTVDPQSTECPEGWSQKRVSENGVPHYDFKIFYCPKCTKEREEKERER